MYLILYAFYFSFVLRTRFLYNLCSVFTTSPLNGLERTTILYIFPFIVIVFVVNKRYLVIKLLIVAAAAAVGCCGWPAVLLYAYKASPCRTVQETPSTRQNSRRERGSHFTSSTVND